MLIRLLFAALLGIVWVNLLVLLLFRTKVIYRYITKKGELRKTFGDESHRWLWLGALIVLVYLTISDLIVLGYNDYGFLTALLLNVTLMTLLLLYNAFLVNGWLLVVVRPMILKISKFMTPITVESYTRFTLIQGGAAAFVLSMISGWVYLLMNFIVR